MQQETKPMKRKRFIEEVSEVASSYPDLITDAKSFMEELQDARAILWDVLFATKDVANWDSHRRDIEGKCRIFFEERWQ